MRPRRHFSIDSTGLTFPYYGDNVIWTWPWYEPEARRGEGKYISLGFTGTAEWGTSRFKTLKDLRVMWDRFYEEVAKVRIVSDGRPKWWHKT